MSAFDYVISLSREVQSYFTGDWPVKFAWPAKFGFSTSLGYFTRQLFDL